MLEFNFTYKMFCKKRDEWNLELMLYCNIVLIICVGLFLFWEKNNSPKFQSYFWF